MTCTICGRPAEVQWPVPGRPHCRRCVAEARAFLDESRMRIPKFSEHARGCGCEKCAADAAPVETAETLTTHIMEAATWLR